LTPKGNSFQAIPDFHPFFTAHQRHSSHLQASLKIPLSRLQFFLDPAARKTIMSPVIYEIPPFHAAYVHCRCTWLSDVRFLRRRRSDGHAGCTVLAELKNRTSPTVLRTAAKYFSSSLMGNATCAVDMAMG
jgi:hypothetical protein